MYFPIQNVVDKVTSRCTEGINVSFVNKKQLLDSSSIVTVSKSWVIPVQLLNPSERSVTIHKNKPLGQFWILDNIYM